MSIAANQKRYAASIGGWISRRLWKMKLHGVKNGYTSDVDRAYLKTLLVDKCPVFGYDLIYGGTGKLRPHNLASLDRINNEVGYMKGNIHIISDQANAMKSSASYDEMLRFSRWVMEMFG